MIAGARTNILITTVVPGWTRKRKAATPIVARGKLGIALDPRAFYAGGLMKLKPSQLLAAVLLAGAALSLCASESEPPQRVHHYHTRTVYASQPKKTTPENFTVVNQYDRQER
jgi:hypothetical protein